MTANSSFATIAAIDVTAFGGDYTIATGDARSVTIPLDFAGSTDLDDSIRFRAFSTNYLTVDGLNGGDAGFRPDNVSPEAYPRGSSILMVPRIMGALTLILPLGLVPSVTGSIRRLMWLLVS